MKRIALTTVILTLAASLPAFADEWSKTYNLSGKPELRIETSDANIRVNTWDQNTIEAKVITTRYKIGEGGIRVEEHQSGDQVEIEVRYPHHGISVEWGQHRVDIIIQMPREGNVNFRTGDGRIEIDGLKGELDLHSDDGSERLDNIDGKLRASTGDGHIRASGRFDELDLKSGDGHLDVQVNPGSTMASAWRLETGDGNVSLAIPGDLSADIDLHSGDGHIDLENISITTGEAIRENSLHGKLNGGGSLLTVHTGDGSIHLRKS